MNDFDFDHWQALAQSSPESFEAERRKALMAQVQSAPEAQRPALLALVDSLCAPQHGSPIEKAVHAQNMMMESLVYLQRSLGDLVRSVGGSAPQPSAVQEFTAFKVQKP